MIDFFKVWCEGIIVAVVISIIIESILPEGNNKKYVKVVVGIYIIFTILSPFLGKLDNEIDFSKSLNLATIETVAVDTKNIQQMYINGIEETMKNTIEKEFGYCVADLEIIYDEKYESIEQVKMSFQEDGISKVEKVEIGANNEQTNEFDEVKSYISENYNIDKDRIFLQSRTSL